jgi:aromatic aminotransferase
MSKAELERAAATTRAAGCWLIIDNTYEHFTYNDVEHKSVYGPNIINIFSFSKAYGMMGWRMGYLAFPDASVHPTLGAELLKVQVRALYILA